MSPRKTICGRESGTRFGDANEIGLDRPRNLRSLSGERVLRALHSHVTRPASCGLLLNPILSPSVLIAHLVTGSNKVMSQSAGDLYSVCISARAASEFGSCTLNADANAVCCAISEEAILLCAACIDSNLCFVYFAFLALHRSNAPLFKNNENM